MWRGRFVGRERPVIIAGLLVLAALVPYLNTFNVPWYFDDSNNIVDNPLIRDLPRAVLGVLQGRGLAMLTFALNHHFGGLNPVGYHVVNLAIHALTVVAVWLLLRQLLDRQAWYWAVVGALLFAVHPVQTQAVTYVVQRMTSLSAFFFIAAVSLYLAFLDAQDGRRRLLYALALLGGALAVLTKEHTAVLPLVLLVAERLFRPGRSLLVQAMTLAPFCLVPIWKALEMLLLPVWRGDVAAAIRYADQLQSLHNVTPLRYLFTEFSVLWYYLKLLALPVGQRLDYGWPVVERLWTVTNLAALCGLIALGWVGWLLRGRRPLLTFGMAWFFITLSVESTLIPLDPLFEHRLYLPMFGFALVMVELLRQTPWPRGQIAVVVVLLPLLALLSWQRNALWNDAVAFMEDNLRRSPDNVRVMVMLGNAYAAEDRPDEGVRMIERAMQLNPRYDFAYTAMGKILIDQGRGAQAIPVLLQGVGIYPESVTLNEYLGIAYGEAGDYQTALVHLRQAQSLNPEDASVYTNLGVIHTALGDHHQAADNFARSVKLAPDSEKAWFNSATALYNLGDNRAALNALRRVLAINPANADAQYGFGVLALEFGLRTEALVAREALLRLGDERGYELDALLVPANEKR